MVLSKLGKNIYNPLVVWGSLRIDVDGSGSIEAEEFIVPLSRWVTWLEIRPGRGRITIDVFDMLTYSCLVIYRYIDERYG